MKVDDLPLKSVDVGSLPYRLKSDCLLGKELLCTRLLRRLPGKRLVCKADYAGKKVLAKIFFGTGYKRRWQREVDGVNHIANAAIKTPDLLETTVDEEKSFAVAIFEFIDNAETLDEQWHKASNDEERVELFKQALEVVAVLHNAAIFQKDIHLSNFLRSDREIYLIDGDQVSLKQGAAGLSAPLAIDNLAMFFTQLYPWQDEWVAPFFDKYLNLRKTAGSGVNLQAVKNKLKAHRAWREKKYVEKKVFRACSEFNLIKDWKTFCVFSREIEECEVGRFISDPDGFIERGEVLKSGRTATVAKIVFAGKPRVVKRYNKKSVHHRLARSLVESRAAVSWRNGHLLRFNGIPTAAPFLMLEQRFGAMRSGSYILTEYIEGENAFDYFSRDDQSGEAKIMAEEIATLIRQLHSSCFSHGDLKAHNIWITGNRPILIDLDGMRKNRNKKRQKQLAREDWSRLYRDLGASEIASVLFKGHGLYG